MFTKELNVALYLFGFRATRLNLGLYLLHPDIVGAAFQCHEDGSGVIGIAAKHEDLNHPIYRQRPICAYVEKNEVVRVRVCESSTHMGFTVIEDLREKGFTNHGVFPLPGVMGRGPVSFVRL